METPDLAHRLTDKELAKLERRIYQAYREAAAELEEVVREYFERFKERDEKQKKLVGQMVNGREYTEEDYKQWRLAQIGRGKRFEALRDRLAERYTQAHEVAVAYVNDATPGIYALNRNYAAYTIEQVAGNVGFDLWDEQTVRRLILEEPGLMPYYPAKRAVKRGIDLAYGKKQITAAVTSGILQGKSIGKLASDLQSRVPEMTRVSALRTARTAVTWAQNSGRLDTYAAAAKMGIQTKKTWFATLDNRTRHAHAGADGQTVASDKPFIVGGYKMMGPGDPSAPGHLVYNCRCAMITEDVNAPKGPNPLRRARDPVTGKSVLIPDMTYAQWESWKKSENRHAWETYMKKGRNAPSDRRQYEEYKGILGADMPKTFAAFQEMKYHDTGKWGAIKALKRQTAYVNAAPCQTTPKKYTGYFLKPGAKHADDFFKVGYTQDDPMRLRYDMARQFDMGKAVDMKELKDGAVQFNIYMELGVDKKRTFLTGWIQDTPDSKPRIVTGFRKNREGLQ